MLVIGVAVLAVAVLHGVFIVRRLWTDPRYAENMADKMSVLPYGPQANRGAVRGSGTLTAFFRRRFPHRGKR